MNSLFQDARFGVRMLCKSPAFAILAVLTLALGIGVNTAIFSVLNTIMLHPLPYPEPERLVKVFRTSPQASRWPHSPANFFDYREQNRVLESVAAYDWKRSGLTEPGLPAESLSGIAATADFFRVLDARPLIGRVFSEEEEQVGKDRVIVLSHRTWVQRFGADTNITSRTVRVDGQEASIIGVMPPTFEYPLLWGHVEVWRPLAFTPDQRRNRDGHSLRMVGRLKPGVTLAQARADLESLGARLGAAYPESNAHHGLAVRPLSESVGDEAGRKFAWFMLGLTGFVLLIACTNLANLQMARAATRTREVAVRLALGAGRGRLARQMFVESVMVALAGGALGLFFAVEISGFIGDRLTFPSGFQGLSVQVDGQVLAFAGLCTVATAVLFGMAPAWAAARAGLNDLLKSGARGATTGRSQNRLQHGLIVAEVALALTLLTGAGLFIGGLQRFIARDPGWNVDGLVSGWLFLDSQQYKSVEERSEFIRRLENRLTELSGVESFGISSALPIWNFGGSRRFVVEGAPTPPIGQEPVAAIESVSPGFFATIGLRLGRGRAFNVGDDTNAPPVIIVNEAMARAFWPGEDPIGKRISGVGAEWQEIVGVVSDVRFPANLNPPDTRWQTYRPTAQEPHSFVSVQLRLRAAAPASVMAEFRRVVAEINPDLPVNELEVTRKMVEQILANFQLSSAFLGVFACLGLLLAAIGIYGVISCFVTQRTGEMGIRIALGARSGDVLWLVLRKGLILALIGLALGLIGAFTMSRLLAAAVPELPANDWGIVAALVGVIISVTLFACWLPARRASLVDPIVALRQE